MISFTKSMLTGAWSLVLVAGTDITYPPVFPTGSNPELIPSPPAHSMLRQHSPWPAPYVYHTPEIISINSLLRHGADYHQQLVAIRGHVTQPELHLDESELFINFVFRLADGDQSVVVFGRHDRTQGALSINLDLSVEVIRVL